MRTVEEFADEILAASKLGLSDEIFRAGVIVALMAYADIKSREAASDAVFEADQMQDLMAS